MQLKFGIDDVFVHDIGHNMSALLEFQWYVQNTLCPMSRGQSGTVGSTGISEEPIFWLKTNINLFWNTLLCHAFKTLPYFDGYPTDEGFNP